MTTGQRIAAKRKERELSQESLGAELGVSRQTVYKWESDTSLPEIEKLVALSRLFHLPVGVLLGVEEAAAAEPPRPVVPRWKRRLWPLLSAALGVVALALVNLCGAYTGVLVPVNRLSLGAAGLLGVPGVTLLILLNAML